jgi:hypothetical protein
MLMICFVLTYALMRHRTLEPFFRLYLSRLVEACPFPLTMTYIPAKSLHLHPTSMTSPVRTFTPAPPLTLSIQPLTPQFYTNILKYTDAASAFALEMENIPQVCDSESQRLWASNPALLQILRRVGLLLSQKLRPNFAILYIIYYRSGFSE